MMNNRYIQFTPRSIDSLKLFSALSESIYIHKNRLLFNENHFGGEAILDQHLSTSPIKIDSYSWSELLESFNVPEMKISKNKMEVRELNTNKSKVLFTDYEHGITLPVINSIEASNIEYQTRIERSQIRQIKELIDSTAQKKGRFTNGNPTRTKIIFTNKRKKQIIRIEDRNHGITTSEMYVEAESTKKKYEYIHAYKLIRFLPDEHYSIQCSCKQYLSEWFCYERHMKFSLDMVKKSYAN
jgi:hypothetical protein